MFCGNVAVEYSEQMMNVLGKHLNKFSKVAGI